MKTRREVIKAMMAIFSGTAAHGFLGPRIRRAFAGAGQEVLPKGTPLRTLIGRNPALLDAHQLDTTPLEAFGTMGQTNHAVDLANWRLAVTGAVDRPFNCRYEDLLKRRTFERNVLLICPGFFAFNGHWAGISAFELLTEAGLRPEVDRVEFSGPSGIRGRTERFTLEDVRTQKVFLAYRVNGVALPQRHGFPLRLVAEGHYGSRWIKYVDAVTAVV